MFFVSDLSLFFLIDTTGTVLCITKICLSEEHIKCFHFNFGRMQEHSHVCVDWNCHRGVIRYTCLLWSYLLNSDLHFSVYDHKVI
jgi:hypothetical protein